MTPVLYSFRRCPYAMRARLALLAARQKVELREIQLRDKPAEMIAASPKATVPVLLTAQGTIDESLAIMLWALRQNDPEGWLDLPPSAHALIADADGPFKFALDRCKYASRYPAAEAGAHYATALEFLHRLEAQLDGWLFGHPGLADYAILPFVRQFAFIDKTRFDALDLPRLHRWLNSFLGSDIFATAMQKPPLWHPSAAPHYFP